MKVLPKAAASTLSDMFSLLSVLPVISNAITDSIEYHAEEFASDRTLQKHHNTLDREILNGTKLQEYAEEAAKLKLPTAANLAAARKLLAIPQ